MRFIAAFVLLLAVATAQQQDSPTEFRLRDLIQRVMALEGRQQQASYQNHDGSTNNSPVVEFPEEGDYEVFQDPAEVIYFPDAEASNGLGYNYDKYESAGKLSYYPQVSRPKRQTQQATGTTTTNSQQENRLTTFFNNVNALSNNLRRQTADALQSALRGQAPNLFQNNNAAAPAAAAAQPGATSLSDVYGAKLGPSRSAN